MATTTNKTLDDLIAELQTAQYTPLSDAEIQSQAQNRYGSLYDQQGLSAQQAYQTQDQALQQQLTGLTAGYNKQRESATEQYNQAYSQTGSNLRSRGMGRSSFGTNALSGVLEEGAKTQNEISSAENLASQNIGQQRTLASQQLAAQLQQYSTAQQNDILAYIDELQAREHDRGTQANQYADEIALKIYELQQAANKTNPSTNNNNKDKDPIKNKDDLFETVDKWKSPSDGVGATTGPVMGFGTLKKPKFKWSNNNKNQQDTLN